MSALRRAFDASPRPARRRASRAHPRRARRARARAGFTLLEMLVVVAFTALVLTFAVAFYVDLARGSHAATRLVERERRAAALLDRVAHDLEHAVLLVKPEEVDPLEHPWLFLAESRGSELGADRLKLDVRAGAPGAAEGPASDLAVVAWLARPGPEGGVELFRWASPRLPERLDRSFPRADDPAAHRVASDLAGFGVRLLDAEGSWVEDWDSSTLARSGTLPLAAEIVVALPPEAEAPPDAEPSRRVRRVLLRTRPLDLQARLEGAGGERGEDEEGEEEASAEERDCVTVAQCRARNPELFRRSGVPPSVFDSIASQCWSDVAANVPVAVEGCE